MKIKYYYSFLLLLIFNFPIHAQDIHFSQFQNAPLTISPTLAGTACGGRLSTNYRNQWASVLKENAFHTAAIGYNQPITLKNGDKIGVGSHFFFDRAGQLDFQTIAGNLIGAYHKKLGSKSDVAQQLSFGLYTGLAHRSIDFEKAQWASQHDGQGGFNGDLLPEDEFANDSFFFFDWGIGLQWSTIFKNKNELIIGTSIAHLNRANQSFDPTKDLPLYQKFNVFAFGNFKMTKNLRLLPRFLSIFQGSSFELNCGTSLQILLKEKPQNAIEIGVATRLANRAAPYNPNQPDSGEVTIWTDAVIFNVGYVHQKFIIALNYDINVSDLNNASNGNGAYEIAVQYRFCN